MQNTEIPSTDDVPTRYDVHSRFSWSDQITSKLAVTYSNNWIFKFSCIVK